MEEGAGAGKGAGEGAGKGEGKGEGVGEGAGEGEREALAIQCDVRFYAQVQRMVAEAVRWKGRVDVVVYNSVSFLLSAFGCCFCCCFCCCCY
jgi:NAD(P)-dependent dehydrogenase (short-subunit alcohol dehydrogenase family)